ncbi:MAG: Rne/Rng family ribonuclease [Acidobacteriota bacterium]|nr:Rne/Rng family ribonuclease [Acidobacteriota bacterium]
MAKEICISSTPHETRLAILEDDQLAEIYYERENEYTLAGSVYNGRVTRVLPGMQSAFVDIGLERDAFLYVTDFLELEDQEDSDELEKAAVSGGIQAPREIRRGGERNSRSEEPANVQESTAAVAATPADDSSAGSEETGEAGAKKWRGRRRRRGGRATNPPSQGTSEAPEQPSEESSVAVVESQSFVVSETVPTRAKEHSSAPFLLPGESLSRYGGTPVETVPKSAAPAKPAVTSRPSTLIEVPLEWDGSGLLPGESISRHRERTAEPATEAHTEAEKTHEASFDLVHTDEEIDFDELEEESMIPELKSELEPEEFEEKLQDPVPTIAEEAEPIAEHSLHTAETSVAAVADEVEETEIAPDAEASHRVDPLPPSGFRLFGFGGKKKSGDDTSESSTSNAAEEHRAARASSYAPGSGLVEEEVIEGEEYEAHQHALSRKLEEHDLDEYEEETLQAQIRSGELGEMLQEAQLDHKIELEMDNKGGEEDEEDESAEDDSEASPDGQKRNRRDRVGRGRRGGRGERGERGERGRRGPSRRSAQTSDLPIISDLLKPGQEILVQIAKEPIAKKGARITSHIALPGRFLVFMPTVSHVGVSRKIASDEERHRLKRILIHERGESSGGFIVRTAAEGASEEELRADLRFLIHLWNEIKERSDNSKSPALIYHDLSLIERILRDQVSANFSNIWVDSEANYERIVRFLNRFSPSLVRRVKLYTKETPLFEHFGIQDEISKALRSKVWLKSGGSIVINQTEALVAIDINTGKYVGKSARLEDTIVKTNLDAVPEIVRQIRLRDLGGIIIIDFIDMDERKNRHKVMAALEEALKSDRAPTKVLQFNDFGLVAITRKRVKQSLERTLSVQCPVCQSTGMVKSPVTVCNEIYVEMRKMRKHFDGTDVLLRVHPDTVKTLKANNARWLNDFEELIGKNLLVKSDPSLHPEQFDIQG